MHLVEGVAKRSVAKRLGLDVKTVRRALAKAEAPERRSSPPRVRALDAWRTELETSIREDPRISAKRLWILLGERGARVSARAVRRYVSELRARLYPQEVFVHRTHNPGDSVEADFGECLAEVDGKLCRAKVLVSVLPASNVYFAKAYPIERVECLLDGLSESFRWFGGVPRRVVLDNTSLAVKKILRGVEREETRAFHGWRGAFPLHADFCAPGKGWEKGSVERGVQYVRGLCFRPLPRACSWDELNRLILAELERDLDRRSLPDGRTARAARIAECEHLRPLPSHLPESCRVVPCVADKYAMVASGNTQTRPVGNG
jgi:transposase